MPHTFVTADLHFGHKRLVEEPYPGGAPPRPFDTLEQMHNAIIERWNRIVRSKDTVYLLGDIAWTKAAAHLIGKLAGRKILIGGNHDIRQLNDMAPYFEKMLPMKITESGYILTHIPIHAGSVRRWEGNIHGHLHAGSLPWPYLCVSMEHTNYTPILIDDAIGQLTNKKDRFSKDMVSKLTEFQRNYLHCALWSSHDDDDNPFDQDYDIDAFHPYTLERQINDCVKFCTANRDLLKAAAEFLDNNPKLLPPNGGGTIALLGHDLWLTRNGHGAGYWDRGLPKEIGDALSDAARKIGGVDLYVDNGFIHQEGLNLKGD